MTSPSLCVVVSVNIYYIYIDPALTNYDIIIMSGILLRICLHKLSAHPVFINNDTAAI